MDFYAQQEEIIKRLTNVTCNFFIKLVDQLEKGMERIGDFLNRVQIQLEVALSVVTES